MTVDTQARMNVVMALGLPVAALTYLTVGFAQSPSGMTVVGMVALGLMWVSALIALNVTRMSRAPALAPVRRPDDGAPRLRVPREAAYVVNVSRPAVPLRWRSILLAPFELLLLAWSIPVVILLVMLPVAALLMALLWIGGSLLQR